MTILSRLTFPTLLVGLLAIAASGIFAVPVKAEGYHVGAPARVTGVQSWDSLNVRRWPAAYSQKVGELAPRDRVWVIRCNVIANSSDWCLVRQRGLEGWVNSRYLSAGR